MELFICKPFFMNKFLNFQVNKSQQNCLCQTSKPYIFPNQNLKRMTAGKDGKAKNRFKSCTEIVGQNIEGEWTIRSTRHMRGTTMGGGHIREHPSRLCSIQDPPPTPLASAKSEDNTFPFLADVILEQKIFGLNEQRGGSMTQIFSFSIFQIG